MKNHNSMIVVAIKEEDAELGRVKSYTQYYFENPVDAAKFYQQLESQPEVIYANMYSATLDYERA